MANTWAKVTYQVPHESTGDNNIRHQGADQPYERFSIDLLKKTELSDNGPSYCCTNRTNCTLHVSDNSYTETDGMTHEAVQ